MYDELEGYSSLIFQDKYVRNHSHDQFKPRKGVYIPYTDGQQPRCRHVPNYLYDTQTKNDKPISKGEEERPVVEYRCEMDV
jgi:hypothetical protein